MRTPYRVLATGSFAAMLLLSSCQKHHTPSEQAATAAATGPQDPALSVKPGGYHGKHFSGPVYIPRSSPMEDGTTAYNVTYQAGVTVVSKNDALHHLVTIQKDGSYLFDSSASQIANLKSGGVLLLSGLALCTVVSVQKTEQGYTLKTSPAKITDAIKEGRFEGTYKIDFARMVDHGLAEFDVDFADYNYHVKFTPRDDRIDVQATIKFGGRQGTLAYEGVGYLSNFVSAIKIQIHDGNLANLDFTNSNLTGRVELKWFAYATGAEKSAAMAKITSWPAELVKNALLSRAAYNVPILVGALPFDLRISLGFSFIPAFTSSNTVLEGSQIINYNGSGGFKLANGQARPSGTMNVQASVSGEDNLVLAAGPVGFTAATEAPRLELAMGWPPASASMAGFLNFITSYGIVTNGMVNPTPCQTNIMAFSVSAGPASTSPNTFATWLGPATGAPSSVSLWQKTFKSAGPGGVMCPG